MQNSIPSLDLNLFLSSAEAERALFVQQLGQAFTEVGFVAIKNHGLSDQLSAELYQVFEQFFTLPDALKNQYEVPNGAGQRGYTGKKKETAKGYTKPDLKEFYHVGQENKPMETALANAYPDNIWPAEVPKLKTISLQAFKVLEQTGMHLLRAIALYLQLPENYFEVKVATGNSILRAIHYYPFAPTESQDPDAVRAAAHEDINLITLLMGASAEGLQILRKDQTWVPVTALPNQIVVNVGDMLARLTNDVLRSTTHRVVNPPPDKWHVPRYAMPFFMHPRSDMDLSCLPSCITATHPKKYADISAGAYLDERLKELGLKK